MNRTISLIAHPRLLAVTLLLMTMTVAICEEQPEQPPPVEEQTAKLQKMFIEAATAHDWKKLEATAEGLKAAGL